MVLELKDDNGVSRGKMLEESLKLGFFNPQNGWILHVDDRDPYSTIAKYQDIRNLKEEDKFVMTDEQYDKREGTLRDHFRKNPALKAKWLAEQGKKPAREDDEDKEWADNAKVGDRCEVSMSEGGKERGTVAYVGKLHERPGYYIGTILDLPVGRNNGTVRGQKYFECSDGYGIMTWASRVEVGDFPEEDFLASSDDDGDDDDEGKAA